MAAAIPCLACSARPLKLGRAKAGPRRERQVIDRLRHRGFAVELFAPSRCPRCHRVFGSYDDFARYAPATGRCFAEALSESFGQFPELFGPDEIGGMRRLGGADFIRCRRCGNATLRLREGEQEVRTEEQALELIARLGYGCLVKYGVPGYP